MTDDFKVRGGCNASYNTDVGTSGTHEGSGAQVGCFVEGYPHQKRGFGIGVARGSAEQTAPFILNSDSAPTHNESSFWHLNLRRISYGNYGYTYNSSVFGWGELSSHRADPENERDMSGNADLSILGSETGGGLEFGGESARLRVGGTFGLYSQTLDGTDAKDIPWSDLTARVLLNVEGIFGGPSTAETPKDLTWHDKTYDTLTKLRALLMAKRMAKFNENPFLAAKYAGTGRGNDPKEMDDVRAISLAINAFTSIEEGGDAEFLFQSEDIFPVLVKGGAVFGYFLIDTGYKNNGAGNRFVSGANTLLRYAVAYEQDFHTPSLRDGIGDTSQIWSNALNNLLWSDAAAFATFAVGSLFQDSKLGRSLAAGGLLALGANSITPDPFDVHLGDRSSIHWAPGSLYDDGTTSGSRGAVTLTRQLHGDSHWTTYLAGKSHAITASNILDRAREKPIAGRALPSTLEAGLGRTFSWEPLQLCIGALALIENDGSRDLAPGAGAFAKAHVSLKAFDIGLQGTVSKVKGGFGREMAPYFGFHF